MVLQGETLTLVIVLSGIAFALIIILCAVIIWCQCSLKKRSRNGRRTTRGEVNQNVPLSDITSISETVPPPETNEPQSFEELAAQHVYRMHQELPPLEPSAPPLPP